MGEGSNGQDNEFDGWGKGEVRKIGLIGRARGGEGDCRVRAREDVSL